MIFKEQLYKKNKLKAIKTIPAISPEMDMWYSPVSFFFSQYQGIRPRLCLIIGDANYF